MGSLLELLDARERAAQVRADGIREQTAVLTQQLDEAEHDLERLRIGRAVVAEVLADEDTMAQAVMAGPATVPVVQTASR